MITHHINKHAAPVHQHGQWPSYYRPRLQHYDRPSPPVLLPYQHRAASPNAMSKLEYAIYLRDLPVKVGDLVTTKFTQKPYHARGVFRIQSIDELHHYVTWGAPEIGPMCLNLQGITQDGVSFITHKGGGNFYHKIADDDIPLLWKEYLELKARLEHDNASN